MKAPILVYTTKARNYIMLTEKSIILSWVTKDTDREKVHMGVDLGTCWDAQDKTGVFIKVISNCSDPDVPPNKNPGSKGQVGSSRTYWLNITAELNCFMKKK